eukprot:TRINITY_DN22975_c0_g1_i1.p1 TRINITY_DN22975_c0_g1~~TRINITY_DN22975_c0_g1_i1.p1  ORF type:complete len:1304 (+),score=175.48 TRINITY_DN22975_c0_g1_i1:55-3966(+)
MGRPLPSSGSRPRLPNVHRELLRSRGRGQHGSPPGTASLPSLDADLAGGGEHQAKGAEPSRSSSAPALASTAPARLGQAPANGEGFDIKSSVEISGGGSPWWDNFVRNQFDHEGTKFRRGVAQLKSQIVADFKMFDDEAFWGARGADGFRTFLKRRYGSILRGWRALDMDRNGRLSHGEFIQACKQMGYGGNLQKLWKELGGDSGFVSIMNLDRETGHYIGAFKLALHQRYGDMLTAWREGVDRNGNGRIEEKEIMDCVERLKLPLDPHKLFSMLREGPKDLGITLQDFDPDAFMLANTAPPALVSPPRSRQSQRRQASRQNLFAETGDSWRTSTPSAIESLPASPLAEEARPDGDLDVMNEFEAPLDVMAQPMKKREGASKRRVQLVERERAIARCALKDADRTYQLGLHSVDEFKQFIRLQFGSLLAGWRKGLDLDGNERLTFGEFTVAVNRIGLHGDVRGLWSKFDPDNRGHILFGDFDPETASALADLRRRLVGAYGNLLLAWLEGIDTLGNGCVNERQFVRACRTVGYPGDAARLFRLMQPEKSRTFITLEDFDTPAWHALSRGDFRMLSGHSSDRVPSSPSRSKAATKQTFLERQSNTVKQQMNRALDETWGSEFAKACRLANAPDHLIDTPEEFEHLCKRKYGSIISAWRNCLDRDSNGVLTFNEFCDALRRLGYGGDFRALWAHYDSHEHGQVRLKDIDPRADELVASFLQLLAARYSTIDRAWKKGFGKDILEPADEGTLKVVCDSIGYPHNARALFRCLQPVPGRQLITIWDVDPLCTRKRQRGEEGYITRQREPGSPRHQSQSPSHSTPPSLAKTKTMRPQATTTTFSGMSSEEALRWALRNYFGSTVSAWRRALDPDMRGTVSFGHFCLVLGKGVFHGNVKAVWKTLCKGKLQPCFRDLDEEAQDLLDFLRERLVAQFGNISNAWQQGFDTKGATFVNKDEFVAACRSHIKDIPVAFSRNWHLRAFQLLLLRQGQRAISRRDLEALLIGVSAERRMELWDGSLSTAAPRENATEKETMEATSFPLQPSGDAEVQEKHSYANAERENEMCMEESASIGQEPSYVEKLHLEEANTSQDSLSPDRAGHPEELAVERSDHCSQDVHKQKEDTYQAEADKEVTRDENLTASKHESAEDQQTDGKCPAEPDTVIPNTRDACDSRETVDDEHRGETSVTCEAMDELHNEKRQLDHVGKIDVDGTTDRSGPTAENQECDTCTQQVENRGNAEPLVGEDVERRESQELEPNLVGDAVEGSAVETTLIEGNGIGKPSNHEDSMVVDETEVPNDASDVDGLK